MDWSPALWAKFRHLSGGAIWEVWGLFFSKTKMLNPSSFIHAVVGVSITRETLHLFLEDALKAIARGFPLRETPSSLLLLVFHGPPCSLVEQKARAVEQVAAYACPTSRARGWPTWARLRVYLK